MTAPTPRTKINIIDIINSHDVSNSIFSYMTESDVCDEQVLRLRSVNRPFDSAVRQTRKYLKIDTSDGLYELRTQWPHVNELFITGTSVDESCTPFVFPDPAIFATLFPSVNDVSVHFAAIDVPSFLTAIGSLPGLTSLDMQSDDLDFCISTSEHLSALCGIIQHAPLQTLALKYSALTVEKVNPLVRTLSANTTIINLDLTRSYCSYGLIAHIMRTNRTVQNLAINYIDTDGDVSSLVKLLAENTNTTLKSLSVLGADVVSIATGMCTNTTLETLALGPYGKKHNGNDSLTLEDLSAVNAMLKVNTSLVALTIDGNMTFPELSEDQEVINVDVNMDAFLTNTTLRTFAFINFLGNEHTCDARNEICHRICQNTGVTKLDLSSCDADRTSVAELNHNTTITSLNLSDNDLDVYVSELAATFETMTNLRELDLRFCGIDPSDREELTERVPSGCTILF